MNGRSLRAIASNPHAIPTNRAPLACADMAGSSPPCCPGPAATYVDGNRTDRIHRYAVEFCHVTPDVIVATGSASVGPLQRASRRVLRCPVRCGRRAPIKASEMPEPHGSPTACCLHAKNGGATRVHPGARGSPRSARIGHRDCSAMMRRCAQRLAFGAAAPSKPAQRPRSRSSPGRDAPPIVVMPQDMASFI